MKKGTITLASLITRALEMRHCNVYWRTGQALVNACFELAPSIAQNMPIEADCFYTDNNILLFLDYVAGVVGEAEPPF
ncbi:MAG TPA: hypothetical protein VIY48_14070 [Candidatus Paceibacterota bacterium]